MIGPRAAAIRQLAAEAGRDPAAILIFAMMTVILAPTDSEAEAKLADYRRYTDPEGALTLDVWLDGCRLLALRSRSGR